MRVTVTETTWAALAAAKALSDSRILVTRAADAEDLLLYASHGDQDAFLLESSLPDMTPLEAVRALRGRCPGAGIVLLAPRGAIDLLLRAFDAGADDVVADDADPREVAARVRAVVRRRLGLARPAIEIGGLVIDIGRRRALVGHSVLALANLEYEILEMLAARAGAILTRDEILNRLYGLEDTAPNPRILAVYIHNIRARIADAGGDPSCIRNVFGRGYCLAMQEPVSRVA